MNSPVKVTPRRKTVLRKFVEKSEDELSSNSQNGTTAYSIVDEGLPPNPVDRDSETPQEQQEFVFVEPAPADETTSLPDSGSASLPDNTYVDPLGGVLDQDPHIYLSTIDERRLSLISQDLPVDEAENENDTLSDLTDLHKTRAREAVLEWKSFVKQSLSVDHLFSLEELNKHLPHHRLRVFVGTWNVNGQGSFGELNDFLFPKHSAAAEMCDLYAIGIQEGLPEFKTWEIALQKTIGLSHVLFVSEAVGTIHISIFLRRDLIWFCTEALVSRLHLRLINQKNSKGFVAAVLYVFGSSFMFVTSHLTAGNSPEKLDVRIDQLNRIHREVGIPRGLELTSRMGNRFDSVDYVFWFGDFNFRLTESRANVENTITEMSSNDSHTGDEHFQKLLGWDQLYRHKTQCIIRDFDEHPISFLPTYKFDLNSDHYDRSTKQRTPSYTDRILFRSNGRVNPIVCRCYNSVSSIRVSDHRPVHALFDVKIRPQVRPQIDLDICAGLFNRDVYTAAVGQLRREQALKKAYIRGKANSGVCVIL